MSKTETPVSQLKINELTKTQFNNASDLVENEIYAVDPEFTGGKLLKTDSNGDIVESTATEADALAGGTAIQGVKVNGSALTPDGNKKVDILTTFSYEQGVASAVWTVQHNLDKYPSVTVVDSAGSVIIADIDYIDENTVKITMNGASKGWAYLN